MLRSIAIVVATLLLALPAPAQAQTITAGQEATVSCGEPPGAPDLSSARARASGSTSGGTPAPASASNGGTPAPASDGECASPDRGEVPAATAAQEPEPDPQGPGEQQPSEPGAEEQPGEPGGEPQPSTGEEPTELPGEEASLTGGGLPSTGLETLKLVFLGIVLVLVGARLRVVLTRRRPSASDHLLADDGLPPEAPLTAALDHPDEPAETVLLPSTATAKRRARVRETRGPAG